MNAKFSMRPARVREGSKTVERAVEWLEVSGLHAGDVVSRRARPADRDRFKTAYQAFLAAQKPPPRDGAAAFVEAAAGVSKRLFKKG